MKTLFTLLILILGMSVSAQPILFKAELGEYSDDAYDWSESKPVELGQTFYISWDTDKDWIKLIGKETTTYYVVTQESSSVEGTEANKLNIIFDCITASGNKVVIAISWFDNDNIAFDGLYDYRWRFVYGERGIGYYCNVLE